tara:strand:- start:139 stop:408 length:270 start_codon:yes stop_codon:yes gene_type:complete
MLEPAVKMEMGSVLVHATQNRGHSAEELTEMTLDKIIHIGDNAPQPIRDQAIAYRSELRGVVLFYIRQAMLSERVTIRAEIAAEMKENE